MNYLNLLNDKQKQAVRHLGPPLLILAGAGSGKTRVITTKIAWLIDEMGYHPRSILAVTFTNKAANEMKHRVMDLVPEAGDVMIRTFHSFGAWLLRRNTHLLDMPSRFSIYDDDDAVSLLKSVINEKLPIQELRWYTGRISRAKDKCLGPEDDLSSVCDDDEEFAELYMAYQNKLEASGSVDFGDLIMRPVHLLRNNPLVKKRIQGRFQVILVDEFQDSNGAQFELLKELYNGENYLCVVGDEDQSIYSFRGAEVENIVEFPKIFPGTEVIMLEQNYRSTGSILDLAVKVVDNNEYRLGKNLWTENQKGKLPVIVELYNQDEEALFCAHLLEDGSFKSTAILYRNNYQSRAFETLFIRQHIPYRIIGTLRFYEREEIKDILAYLRFLLNPRDEISFKRALGRPARGIGAKNLEKIEIAPGEDFMQRSNNALSGLSKKAREGLTYFINVINEVLEMLESHTLSEVIHHLILRSGLHDYYREKDKKKATMKTQNLEEFVNATTQYPGGLDGLSLFLESTLLDGSREDPYAEEEKVTLITVHNTKGLEFDRVILSGLEDGLFPYISNTEYNDDDNFEEERRLFYVGVTRAKKELYLTYCTRRLVFGSYIPKSPSRFLLEIPGDCVQSCYNQGSGQNGEFPMGTRVMHPEYGPGTVDRQWHNDDDEMVLVKFDNGKYLQFITVYSKLERIY
jgi:DNA helicase II / ATP-dependent DNA helicase PcrA